MKTMNLGLLAFLLSGAALAACGDDSATGGSGGTGGGSGGQGGDEQGGQPQGGDSTDGGGGAGVGGSGGAGEADIEVVLAFDPGAFELPEGLAIHDGDAIVGFALTGAIDRITLPDAERSAFASTPPPPAQTAFVTGVTFDDADNLYAAFVSFTADATPGVYRALAGETDATLWATHASMVFPNGFARDAAGVLYVTDSAAGVIFQIDADGNAVVWASDDTLVGDLAACGQEGMFNVGANGIVRVGDAFYVANSDLAQLVRIPIEGDGSAGTPEIVAGPDCDALGGIDGLTVDDDGTIVAAINRANRIVRINTDGEVAMLAEGAPLDFPASLEFAGTGADRALYVTSFALGALLSGGEPHPALVKVTLP